MTRFQDENYVIFGNKDEIYELFYWGIDREPNVVLFNYYPLREDARFAKKLCRAHHSYKLNKKVDLPFKWIWYPKYIEQIPFTTDSRITFIFYDHNYLSLQNEFLACLKREYPFAVFVYVFTDIVELSGCGPQKARDTVPKLYDAVFTFDMDDARKYGFKYAPLVYACDNTIPVGSSSDVFYLGRAKDRYDELIGVYECLREVGLHCDFYIVGVRPKEQRYPDEIHYNKLMSYYEAVGRIKGSRCLVDVIQGGASGYTIKNCEAVIYGKHLLTTNRNVVNSPFYDSRFVHLANDFSPAKASRLVAELAIDANYPASAIEYFSPMTFLEKATGAARSE